MEYIKNWSNWKMLDAGFILFYFLWNRANGFNLTFAFRSVSFICGFSWILHTMKKLRKFNWKLRLTQRSSCTHNMNVCVFVCVCHRHSYIDYERMVLREWRVSCVYIWIWDFRFDISQEYNWRSVQRMKRKSAKPEPLYCYKRHRVKTTNKVFEKLRANAKDAEEKRKKNTYTRTTTINGNVVKLERILLLKFDIVKLNAGGSCKVVK